MSTITITVTDEQIKLLQSGEPITIEPLNTTIVKWKPTGGKYLINRFGDEVYVDKLQTASEVSAGLRYSSKEKAEEAAKAIRSYARQLKWLAENDDGWKANWSNGNQFKHYVYFSEDYKKSYQVTSSSFCHNLNGIYMSKENANKLCKLLNEGIVEF